MVYDDFFKPVWNLYSSSSNKLIVFTDNVSVRDQFFFKNFSPVVSTAMLVFEFFESFFVHCDFSNHLEIFV